MKFGAAILVMVGFGCSGPKEGEEHIDRTPRRVRQLAEPNEYVVPGLISSAENIRTVQLYRRPDETNLPIIALGTGERLSLEFDLVEDARRPLSVYFYHADRQWTRDLTPAQFLTSFQRDEIQTYEESRATEVPYVHYSYSFPNESIDFRVSGNYVVRVSEQGIEDDVILERAFYVTEQAVGVDFTLASIVNASSSYPAVQPFAIFSPPEALRANTFGFAVCFAQNGRAGSVRCTDEASLSRSPALEYYLRPSSAFDREGSEFFLDLSLLQRGGTIEEADLGVSPHEVVLEPDFAQLGGGDFYPLQNGQTVIKTAVKDVSVPATEAEYVRAWFALVPPSEQPLGGRVHVVGSFNNWQTRPENEMTWYEDEGRYEGNILVKQGRYEYRYVVREGREVRNVSDGFPRQDFIYTSFVYYDDAFLQTDRLIAVAAARTFD